ncbi:hypothetical protein KY285_028951 [Solanum tuberosum]|nr:hypothetical protein KY285_028951 [Solanum tuberosum]
MGISTIHMSAFVLSLRDNKTKGQPSLYLGLVRMLEQLLYAVGVEGGGCRRLIEAEAGATGAICVESFD